MFSNRPGSEHLSERMNTNTGLFIIHTPARAFPFSFPPLIGCGWKKKKWPALPRVAPILPPNDKSLQMWWAGAQLCLCVIAKCQQALEKGSLEHTTTCLTFRPKLTPGARQGLPRLMSGFGADGTGTAVTLKRIEYFYPISSARTWEIFIWPLVTQSTVYGCQLWLRPAEKMGVGLPVIRHKSRMRCLRALNSSSSDIHGPQRINTADFGVSVGSFYSALSRLTFLALCEMSWPLLDKLPWHFAPIIMPPPG